MMRSLPLALLVTFLLCACESGPKETEFDRLVDREGAFEPVRTWGSLRAILHDGDTSDVVALDSLLPDEYFFAVGAIAGLRGEITIRAGDGFLTYAQPDDSTNTMQGRIFLEDATLLVGARVWKWKSIEVPHDVRYERLDESIRELAAGAGIDTSEPFPFLVNGPMGNLRWHVIDGSRLTPGQHSHEDHLRAAIAYRIEYVADGRLVGFYSDKHEGVFTHRGSRTHIHTIVADPLSSGHVDEVVLLKGATLFVPDVTGEEE